MKVLKSEDNLLELDNGLKVIGDGETDCCNYNYLDFEQLPIGTELDDMNIFEFAAAMEVKEDGFSISDKEGIPKWVQARSKQNGYYSYITTLLLEQDDKKVTYGRLEGVHESDG